MNRPSYEKFAPVVKSGGVILVNTTLISVTVARDDVDELRLPVNDIALGVGSVRSANIVALSAFVARSRIVDLEVLRRAVETEFGKKPKLIPLNMKAMDAGIEAAATTTADAV